MGIEPTRGGRQSDNKEGVSSSAKAEGSIGGRSVRHNPEDSTARLISALGFEGQFEKWGEALASMQDLTDQQIAVSDLAKQLYSDDMPPASRLRVLMLVEQGGEDFVKTVKRLGLRHSPGHRTELFNKIVQKPSHWSAISALCPEGGSEDKLDETKLIELILRADPEWLTAFHPLFQEVDGWKERIETLETMEPLWVDLRKDALESCIRLCSGQSKSIKDRLRLLMILNQCPNSAEFEKFISEKPEVELSHLAILSSLNDRWMDVYNSANQVVIPRVQLLFQHGLALLVKNIDRLEPIMTTFMRVASLRDSFNTRVEILEKCSQFKPLICDLALKIGENEEPSNRYQCLILLDALQEEEIFKIYDVIDSQTPLKSISKLALNILNRIPFARCLTTFYSSFFNQDLPPEILSISPDGPILKEVLIAIDSALIPSDSGSTRRIQFKNKDSGEIIPTSSLLERACQEIPKVFASILRKGSEGFLLALDSNEEMRIQAKQLGQLLFFLTAEGVCLPDESSLDPELFDKISLSSKAANKNDADSLVFEVAKGFCQNGRASFSSNLRQILLPIQLPPAAQLHLRTPLKPRIHERVSDIPEINALFKNAEDISDPLIKELEANKQFSYQYRTAMALFTQEDTAEQRLQLIDAVKSLKHSEGTVKEIGKLVLPGDSVDRRKLLLNLFSNYEVVPERLPITSNDSALERYTCMRFFSKSPVRIAIAQKLPIPLNSTIRERMDLVASLENVGFDKLSDFKQVKLLKLLYASNLEDAKLIFSLLSLSSFEDLERLLGLSQEKIRSYLFFVKPFWHYKRGAPLLKRALDTLYVAASLGNDPYELIKRLPFQNSMSNNTILRLLAIDSQIQNRKKFYGYLSASRGYSELSTIIKCLYQLEKEQLNIVIEALPATFTGTVINLLNLNPKEQQTVLDNIRNCVQPYDTKDCYFYIFRLFSTVPLSEHAKLLELLSERLLDQEDRNLREIFFYNFFRSQNYNDVEKMVLNLYSAKMKRSFPDHRENHIDLKIDMKQPIIPQLENYLSRPLGLHIHVQREGDPGADYGGLTREVLSEASREIRERFGSLFQEEGGLFSISPEGEMSFERRQEYMKCGRLLFMMAMHQTPLPTDFIITKEVFEAAAALAPALFETKELFGKESLADLLQSDNNQQRLASVFNAIYAYEIKKFGADSFKEIVADIDELKEYILQREGLFQITRGLCRDGHVSLYPLISRLLTPVQDIRALLLEDSSWNFSALTGDQMLQKQYIKRWISEANESKLTNLVFSISGSKEITRGKVFEVRNTAVDGPFPHTCFDIIDLPEIPEEGQPDPYNLRNYESWKSTCLDDLPIKNWKA